MDMWTMLMSEFQQHGDIGFHMQGEGRAGLLGKKGIWVLVKCGEAQATKLWKGADSTNLEWEQLCRVPGRRLR